MQPCSKERSLEHCVARSDGCAAAVTVVTFGGSKNGSRTQERGDHMSMPVRAPWTVLQHTLHACMHCCAPAACMQRASHVHVQVLVHRLLRLDLGARSDKREKGDFSNNCN